MPQYLYQFLPGSRPELATEAASWTVEDEVISARHFEYLQRAMAAGILILAGRSQDGVGPAVVIFEAKDDDSARKFMEDDPFVKERLFRASLHPYRVALIRDPG